jgi:enoyl-CoA hydratase
MTETMTAAAEPDLHVSREGAAGILTLNRPRQLNALTHGMVRTIAATLDAWENDPAVTRIVLLGAGGKAFCAGGDIRALHDAVKTGESAGPRAFWRDEYILNRRLKRYPKPVVALIDGIVMGGGVGLAFHVSHRIATERLTFAMPEVGIGFFPDVGATWLLPRLPGFTGTFLAVTGHRIGQGDAMALRLATHAVPSRELDFLTDALTTAGAVDDLLGGFAAPPPPSPIAAHRGLIDHAFASPSLPAIMARLEAAAAGNAFAAEALASMKAKSPTSMAVALEQMHRGGLLSFEEAMVLEYRIVSRIGLSRDFVEGVRAVIIDRDQKPRWQPDTIADLDPRAIAAVFAPLADDLAF